MSGKSESGGKDEGWIDYLGILLVGAAFIVFAWGAAAAVWFWCTTIIPFFWERGDHTPAIGSAAIVFLIVGGIILNRNKES